MKLTLHGHPKRDLKLTRYSTQTVILTSISPSVCNIEVKKTKRLRPQSAQSAVQSVGIGALRALRAYMRGAGELCTPGLRYLPSHRRFKV